MSKEEKEKCETKDHCKCFVHCECFQKFLIVTFGSFIGVFFALTLFAASHKPPMPCPFKQMQPPPMEFKHQQMPPKHHGHFHHNVPPMDVQKPVK